MKNFLISIVKDITMLQLSLIVAVAPFNTYMAIISRPLFRTVGIPQGGSHGFLSF